MLESNCRNPYVVRRNGCASNLQVIEYGGIKISGSDINDMQPDSGRIQKQIQFLPIAGLSAATLKPGKKLADTYS